MALALRQIAFRLLLDCIRMAISGGTFRPPGVGLGPGLLVGLSRAIVDDESVRVGSSLVTGWQSSGDRVVSASDQVVLLLCLSLGARSERRAACRASPEALRIEASEGVAVSLWCACGHVQDSSCL